MYDYVVLAKGPGVARGNRKKTNFDVTPRLPMSVHKKNQLIRSSRLVGYREHIYECLVLLYRFKCLFINVC